MKHLLGSTVESHAHSHSATPFLMEYLVKELQIRVPDEYEQHLQWAREHAGEFTPILAVELATTQMRGPEQKVEFLAKRLAYGSEERFRSNRNVLLATPIYVAMGD